jgi:lipopolysaccharide biosynthesis glycosyltransferase
MFLSETNTKIPIFFIGSNDLIDTTCVAMCSILSNTTSFIDFFILDLDILNHNKKHLNNLKKQFNNFSIEYIKCDLKVFDGCNAWRGYLDCWARFLFMDMKPDIKRAIYLDSDIICYDDIIKLWNEDLGENTVGAIIDIGQTKIDNNIIQEQRQEKVLINSGVLLIDCDKWRQQDLTKKIIEIGKIFGKKLICPDQCALQILFDRENNCKLLNYRYNFQERKKVIDFIEYTDEYIKNEFSNIVIQHFCSKPWKTTDKFCCEGSLVNFNEWWYYASMTPFFMGLQNRFIASTINDNKTRDKNKNIENNKESLKITNNTANNTTTKIKLFGFIPLLKVKVKR